MTLGTISKSTHSLYILVLNLMHQQCRRLSYFEEYKVSSLWSFLVNVEYYDTSDCGRTNNFFPSFYFTLCIFLEDICYDFLHLIYKLFGKGIHKFTNTKSYFRKSSVFVHSQYDVDDGVSREASQIYDKIISPKGALNIWKHTTSCWTYNKG